MPQVALPAWAAWAATASAVAGAAVSAYGMVQQGRAQKAQAQHEARVTESNALQESFDSIVNESVAQANKETMQREAYDELRKMAKAKQSAEGSAIVRFAQSGADLGSGSIESILAAEEMEYQDMRRQLKVSASNQARNLNMQKRGFKAAGSRALTLGRNRAMAFRAAGSNAASSAYTSAFGQVLSGVGQGFSMAPAG